MRVLSRRSKNNPILIGNPGVGKTSIAKLLAQLIVEKKVPDSLKNLKIIYGGSVNAKNALQLFALESVDGGLIGRASLDVGEFVSICKAATQTLIK